nr:putative pentatricopeptide repeat-containing protein At1g17630 [Tanacetum cinerariifolium]
MLKVAKLYQEPEQSLIPPSGKTKKKKIPSFSQPKSSHKVRVIPPKKQVAETQHVEVTVATADATKSLEASESTEEQENQPLAAETKKEPEKIVEIEEDVEDKSMEIPTVEQLLDEVDKQNKIVQETLESPYDTESEIKVVNSYFTSQIPKLQDQIMHDSDESTDYESMPKDDLRSVSGFETTDSDDTQGNDVSHSDHTFLNHNASAELSDGFKSTLPALVNTALQEQLPRLLSATLKDCLPSIIQESLQTHILASFEQFAEKQTKLNKKVVKHLNRQFNIFYVAQSDRFARIETKLSKTLKYDIGKLVTTLVKSAEPLVESQGEKLADLNVVNKESAPPASDAKLNDGEKIVVHNSEENKSEGIISVEDDLDEDDKQPLSKRFKIMTPNPDIPNPNPLNTFVPEHLLKPKEQQKSIQEFTDQLFKTISSRFSPTPLRKLTPLKDSSKGKAVAIIEKSGNELVKSQEEGVVINQAKRIGLPSPPELATFGLSAEEKKRKMTDLIKEVFITENVRVDGMDRNLIPPPEIMPIQGLVINEPESRIFFMNGNTGIGQGNAKRIGLPSPPELATFGLSAEEKKRKRTDLIKEVFITENVRVDGMDRNLIPLPEIMPSRLSIEEPLSTGLRGEERPGFALNCDCDGAREMVERMEGEGCEANYVTWTSLLSSYDRCGRFWETLRLYNVMRCKWVKASAESVSVVVSVCDDCDAFNKVRELHRYVVTSLVNWNALILSYAQAGLCDKALSTFLKLKNADKNLLPNVLAKVKPNLVTVSSLLSVCADLSTIHFGKELHACVIRNIIDTNLLVDNGLINMYAKCASLKDAHIAFKNIKVKDLCSYNTMIKGYGIHGHGESALKIFKQMIDGYNPDGVTFVSLLSACSHTGIVIEGRKLFNQMKTEFGIEHYACMVDLFGRAGLFQEASEVAKRMPIKPNVCVWGALLNSSRMHKNIDWDEGSVSKILDVSSASGNYMLLSIIYAESGQWDDSAKVRVSAKARGLTKTPGQSWIELNKTVHMFTAGEFLENEMTEVETLLNIMSFQMKMKGYGLCT